MKANEVRRLCTSHPLEVLQQAAEALAEEGSPAIEVVGDDAGEQLTHVMLASQMREQMDAGVPVQEAFRQVMSRVRGVLANET